MSDAIQLPARPSLEQYKKLAKDLHHAAASQDPEAIKKWAAAWVARGAKLVRFGKETVDDAQTIARWWQGFHKKYPDAGGSLTAAQFFLSRAHGFESWPKFAEHVRALENAQSPSAQFEAAADAIVSGDIATLREMLRANPEIIHARSDRDHRSTLLHYVAANGFEDYRQKTPQNIVEIAKLLLDAGADVNAESDAYGGRSTTLGLTATSAHPKNADVQIALLELLIERGAIIEHADGDGAVRGSLANGCSEAAQYLAERGARVDLIGAAGMGRIDIVESLLERGANPGAAGRHGDTALHQAAYAGHAKIVELLLSRGAPVDPIDNTHQGTPLAWAEYGLRSKATANDYYTVIAMLVRAGAAVDPEWRKIDDPKLQSALRGE